MKLDKAIIFLGDGMADELIPELDDRTPLQHAATPAMDQLAREGRCGSLLTLPEGFPTSSDVANMSVLGCDLETEFTGRGPLEAAGRNIVLDPTDIAMRMNLISVADGTLTDYSAGHIEQDDASGLIAHLSDRFDSDAVRFYSGVSFRNIAVISGEEYSANVETHKPDDHQGGRVYDYLPSAGAPDAQPTVDLLMRLIREVPDILSAHEINQRRVAEGKPTANGVWPWSLGRAGAIRTLQERYDIRGAVISAVDVIKGLGLCLGMDVIPVDGATGYIDTNYAGKADAAIDALENYDLVFLHVEAVDEVSHEQDLEKKLQAIEDFDSKVVGRVMSALDNRVAAAVLPDHPVPLSVGIHTRTPVPVAVRRPDFAPDSVSTFDEIACPGGALGAMETDGLMRALVE